MQKKKFNIYKFLEGRPLSFSAFNTFSDPMWGSPEKWYASYIKGIRQTSPELTFGSAVDKQFQEDPAFLPEIERYENLQHKMEAILELGKKKVRLIGITDGYTKGTRHKIMDLKTGRNPWNSKKAAETKQLTFYALLLFLTEGVRPEDVDFEISWCPTYVRADLSIDFVRPIAVQTFKTRRTMADIVKLCGEIDKCVKDMQKYYDNSGI